MLYNTENPHGGDIYGGDIDLDFSANTNPFGTPEGVLAAVRDALPDMHRYPDPYCRRLVGAISEFEGVPREYILCGNGAADLIYSFCEAVRPKTAVELAPTFSEYSLGLERVGCRTERYVLDQKNSFDIDSSFADYLEVHRPEAVFLCNPNNPTGRLAPVSLMEQVLGLCDDMGTRLFVDECFLDLTDNGVSMKSCLADHPGLFILKAFTKSYGMAGLRLGYGLCSDSGLLSAMSRTVQPWNVSAPAQAAGAAALKEDGFLEKTKDLVRTERSRLEMELEKLGFQVLGSSANYILFHGAPELDTKLRNAGIAIRNCGNYVGLGPGWYRIAVRLHDENTRLLEAVGQICGKE